MPCRAARQVYADPAEWVALGAASGGTRATSLRYVGAVGSRSWQWVSCRVTAYDAGSGRYTLVFEEDGRRKRKTAWRIAVKFDAERAWLFERRREFALVRAPARGPLPRSARTPCLFRARLTQLSFAARRRSESA